ncbi:hypothetical protein KY49_7068 [Burkholderia sp. MSHR3999]|nr:hypothetical protein KY49_7068 [Burkholderia sp. MSHR3999]
MNTKQDSQMRVPATATHGDISTMSPTRMNNGKKRNSTDAMLVHVSFQSCPSRFRFTNTLLP